MSAPSPAPWAHNHDGFVVDAHGVRVADARPWNGGGSPPPQAPFNGRLIAAAPELLEATRQARAWILEAEHNGYSQPSDITVGALDAAIAKATGGQS